MDTEKGEIGFDKLRFDDEFRRLFKAYESTWAHTPGGATHGPHNKIRGRMRHFLPQAQQDAEKPEEEAYEKLVEYAASAIVIALLSLEEDPVIRAIELGIDSSHHLDINWRTEFMGDVIRKMIELKRRLDEPPKKNIDAPIVRSALAQFIDDQRKKYGGNFNFGIPVKQ